MRVQQYHLQHLALVAHLVCVGLFADLANAHPCLAACRGVGGVLVRRRVGGGQGGQGGHGGQGQVGGGGEGKGVGRVRCVRVGSANW